MDEPLGKRDQRFVQRLQECDRLIIAGQAKSHCVAWTVSDLLDDIMRTDTELARKVYLLEDCTSPVVVPGVVDHTEAADAAYEWFAKAGMNIIQSTTPVSELISQS
jgi:nicotinamidase-related amidase